VAVVKAAGLAGVLVLLLAPGRRVAELAQRAPGSASLRILLVIAGRGDRNQSQWPEQHLAEVAHGGAACSAVDCGYRFGQGTEHARV